MSIRTSFNPLGTLGGHHGFPLPQALTRGLLDAVISGYDKSWNNRIVHADMHMDVAESADVLLRAETAIIRLGSALAYSNSVVASQTNYYDIQFILKSLAYAGFYIYQGDGRRNTTSVQAVPGGTVAVTNIQTTNEQCVVVYDSESYMTSFWSYSQKSYNKVKFTNVDKIFFYNYVMTVEEMKEKISIVENLDL